VVPSGDPVKGPSPLLGFNNNVKHKGRVFHIQTEDSGIHHPHVITHLFADGGRILKTKKTSYAEHVGDAGMTRTVRTMMQDQHKAMFIALRGGHFDHLLEGLERPAQDRSSHTDGAAPIEGPASSSKGATAPSPSPSAVRMASASAATEPAMAASAQRPAGASAPSRPPHGNLELDLDTLERAAQAAQGPVFQEIHGLPPPPAAVMGANRRAPTGTTSYRSVTPVSQTTMPSQSVPTPPLESPPASARDSSREARPSARRTERPRVRTPSTPAEAAPSAPETARASDAPGRYAPSRPASIFGSSRPAEGASIFGEELISEKSLDEVILGYLAEDLEGPAPKK
jgi:hypothetical protein